MKFILRRCEDILKIEALHTLIFPDDEQDSEGTHWVAYDELGTPVGFCSARMVIDDTCVYFTRAGLLPCAEGYKLQQRMIQVRLNWGKQQDASWALTYTSLHNYPSINNLLKKSFRFYTPEWPWVGNQFHYFHRRLNA